MLNYKTFKIQNLKSKIPLGYVFFISGKTSTRNATTHEATDYAASVNLTSGCTFGRSPTAVDDCASGDDRMVFLSAV
jgi:hypothetical protein